MLVVFVIVCSDSDRVGRGEWSRVYDACMVVRVYLSGLRAPCMPRRCLRRLETRHPYHLGGVFWYGSSISIIIYLSLIRGISSVADGENVNCQQKTTLPPLQERPPPPVVTALRSIKTEDGRGEWGYPATLSTGDDLPRDESLLRAHPARHCPRSRTKRWGTRRRRLYRPRCWCTPAARSSADISAPPLEKLV